MASPLCHFVIKPLSFFHPNHSRSHCPNNRSTLFLAAHTDALYSNLQHNRQESPNTTCSASNGPSSPSEFSSDTKIRSEVLSPFRSVRMFFYLAFIASGSIGTLIATTQLIGAKLNPERALEIPEILKSVGIDVAAVIAFAFLYSRENNAKQAQLSRLQREESLASLKVRVNDEKIISIGSLRGKARIVICAGPSSFISEAFNRSAKFTRELLERGVLVVPLSTDETAPHLDFSEDNGSVSEQKRLWRLVPVYLNEWSKWLEEQKKLANVSADSPVYLSLRLDGRVRGSGVAYPPWNALVAQLPLAKGVWSGLLDGMDGRV